MKQICCVKGVIIPLHCEMCNIPSVTYCGDHGNLPVCKMVDLEYLMSPHLIYMRSIVEQQFNPHHKLMQ